MPFVEVFECHGVHSYVFRGPTGTSRWPILVPPKEYWTAREAGRYKFVLRYPSGNVSSRLVTPEVFARYNVGDSFYDRLQPRDQFESDDSKAVQPVVHHRQTTAQVRKRNHKARHLARHRKVHRSRTIAQR